MITNEERLLFFRAMGNKKGEAIFRVIDELRPYIDDMQRADVQSYLMEDINGLISVMGNIFNGLLNKGEITPADIATFQVLWKRLQRRSEIEKTYNDSVEQVKNAKHTSDALKKRLSAA